MTGKKADLVFWQKPGCINNGRQLEWLAQADVEVEDRNLLTTAWTPETLRPFFADKSVSEWFNRTAPAVKQGEIDPENMTEEQALAAMIDNPILIRRPLIQTSNLMMSGFDLEAVLASLGQQTEIASQVPADIETCKKDHTSARCADPQEEGVS